MHDEAAAPPPRNPDPPEPPILGVSPRWHDGDAWEVRYRLWLSSPVNSENPPPYYEESNWRYTVERTFGTVQITASCTDGDGLSWDPRGMVLAPAGRLLAVRPDSPTWSWLELTPGPHVPFDFTPGEEPISSWPWFPLRAEDVDFEDGAVTQHVDHSDAGFRITLARRGVDFGDPRERIAVQEWEANRPWWSSLKVSVRGTYKGETFEGVELEGRVTSWASEP